MSSLAPLSIPPALREKLLAFGFTWVRLSTSFGETGDLKIDVALSPPDYAVRWVFEQWENLRLGRTTEVKVFEPEELRKDNDELFQMAQEAIEEWAESTLDIPDEPESESEQRGFAYHYDLLKKELVAKEWKVRIEESASYNQPFGY